MTTFNLRVILTAVEVQRLLYKRASPSDWTMYAIVRPADVAAILEIAGIDQAQPQV